MINTMFHNTLFTGTIISALILLTFAISPLLNKEHQIVWRLSTWKMFMVFLIMPFGLLMHFIINNIKIPMHTAAIANNISGVGALSVPVSSFETILETPQVAIWTKLNNFDLKWLSIIWFIGIVVITLYLITVYLHFTYKINKNSKLIQSDNVTKIQEKILAKHKGKKPLVVRQCTIIATPMILGIVNPTIFIPSRDYSISDLKIIIIHELTHYLRNDLLYKGLFIILLIIHWYNPVIHIMVKTANKDMELCCDCDAIAGKAREFRADYSNIIMSEIIYRSHNKAALFACMGSEKKIIEERFKNIFSDKKKVGKAYLFAALLLTILLLSEFAYASEYDIFQSNDYQQLLQKTIDKKIVDAVSERERSRFINNREYRDIPNFDELASQVMDEDGNFDLVDVYELAGVKYPDTWFDVKTTESYFCAIGNYIEPHILGNGQRAVYSPNSGKPWSLNSGDNIEIHIFADINKFEPKDYKSKGGLTFGYIQNNQYIDIENFTINDEKKFQFEVPETGEYKFYLFCPSSSDIVIKLVSIDVK